MNKRQIKQTNKQTKKKLEKLEIKFINYIRRLRVILVQFLMAQSQVTNLSGPITVQLVDWPASPFVQRRS